MPTLQWLTGEADRRAAAQVPFRLLTEQSDLSYGQGENGLLVQGDNLEALKALLPFYAGRVKCIYIDPPYNTRSAFEHYDDNLEHAQWLGMIVPRLMLLREFLSEDGSIWVSIDDNEGHYLKVVMDEVFGRRNFVSTFVWERDAGGRGDAVVSSSHDFILCYARSYTKWRETRNLLPRTDTQDGSRTRTTTREVHGDRAMMAPQKAAPRNSVFLFCYRREGRLRRSPAVIGLFPKNHSGSLKRKDESTLGRMATVSRS